MSKNKIQIPKLILDHLLQYGNTSISGLGTLFYNHHSAYLSDDKLQIFPPSNTLIFKDSNENSDHFISYVANRFDIKPKKALEKVDKYSQHIIDKLINYGEAEIPSVGQFTRVNGDDIRFLQYQGVVNSSFFGLPPVNLKPIQFFKDGDMINAAMSVSTESIPNRSVAATTIATKSASSNPSSDNYNYDESRWFKVLLWIFCILLLCALFYKGCEVDKKNEANLPSVSYVDNGGIGNANGENENTESDSSNTGDKVAIVDTITKKNNPTECVIILGAYQSARNAMKMSTKISQLGYTPYEEYFDTMNLTRVGFKFDCREKDLYDFMHEVRKEIVQDAWYLVPRITVK